MANYLVSIYRGTEWKFQKNIWCYNALDGKWIAWLVTGDIFDCSMLIARQVDESIQGIVMHIWGIG